MKKMEWIRRHGGWLLAGIGIAFLAIGCLRQEQLTVLKKAIMICLECIGIG